MPAKQQKSELHAPINTINQRSPPSVESPFPLHFGSVNQTRLQVSVQGTSEMPARNNEQRRKMGSNVTDDTTVKIHILSRASAGSDAATPPDVNLAVLHELQRGRKSAEASGAARANPRGTKRNHDGEGTDLEPIDAHGLKQRSQGTAGGGSSGTHRDNHE